MKKPDLKNLKITGIAPAKVILSGEYSVLYGASALATAISLHIKASLEKLEAPIIRVLGKKITQYSLEECRAIAQKNDRKYDQFLAGHIPIKSVLNHSDDLLLSILNRRLDHSGKQGFAIDIRSSIPIGSGFGSSSAVISVLSLIAAYMTGNPFKSNKELIAETRYMERLQHGKAGIIDSTTIVEGGIVHINYHMTVKKQEDLMSEWWAVDTGKPEKSTGECVSFVNKYFAKSSIWSEFNAITNNMAKSIQNNDADSICNTIRLNHSFLKSIGVVPEPICQFICSIEAKGGAAKISGAGNIKGNKAGLVLVYNYDPRELSSLYKYPCYKIKCEQNGTMLA
ncbi:mevalonate kinase [Candidatus Liberibacter sp.]|uniref:mevalonate kinase family protein n=1 Tax=Candidatus Liberibacter sp. TaxID=34022 RepID=UPI0015F5B564|nr:GHMP kinase [Candidatus Liberibacter sp.]MBA5724371.1 GHMP kinase [Candidatus Liberibacter sp.]